MPNTDYVCYYWLMNGSKIAFLRVGALGDLLVGLAALAETIELNPHADIFVVGGRLWLEILEAGFMPQIKGIFVLDDNKSTQGQLYAVGNGIWLAHEKKMTLRNFFKNIDVLINTRIDSLRFVWPALFAGVQTRYGSAPWPFSFLYTHNSPWLGKDPLIHERDAALRLLDGKTSEASLVVKWQKQGGLPATKLFNQTIAEKKTNSKWKKYCLVNPTASRVVKAWPKEKFRELIEALLAETKLKDIGLIVIGSPSETEWLEYVANKKVMIVQPKNISELIDVVAGAKFLIANTSSMQFVAASTKTPVVTLMGSARPEIWGPIGKNDLFLLGNLSSTRHLLSQDEQEVLAFKSIKVDSVLSSVLKIIDTLN